MQPLTTSTIPRLDYAALDLQRFLPGAVIRHNGAFHTISDPFRAPLQALEGLFAPVGTLADKLRVALLRNALLREPLQTILSPSALQMPLDTFLLQRGFTPAFISAFFRPFYQGIFLAPLSEQSSSMFQFVFRMFAEAPASLPANGIGSVTQLMREQLPANVEIHLNTPVTYVDAGHVEVRGEVLTAPIIVLATEGPEAVRLLGSKIDTNKSRGSICLYFASDRPSPVSKPILVLNGDSKEEGPVNNMFVPSQVAPGYAPPGKTLISTTIVGDGLGKGNEALEREVRQQMSRWFGEEKVNEWRLLAVYRIPHSQSAQSPDFVFHRETQLGEGLFVCGDHRNSPTLHGAIRSGQAAARQALDFVSIIDS